MKTITANFEKSESVGNVLDDLINHGIEREKIFADEKNHQLKVMIPEAIEGEVDEIINRHKPVH